MQSSLGKEQDSRSEGLIGHPALREMPFPPEPGFPWLENEGLGLKGRPAGTAVPTGTVLPCGDEPPEREGFKKSWGSISWRW